MTATDTGAKPPWHFWLVLALAALWNGFGAYDYVMSNAVGESYFRANGMTDAQIAYMNAYPTWLIAVWATGVWAAVAATLFLLLRRRWAYYAFALSFAAILVILVHGNLLSDASKVMGPTSRVMNVVLVVTSALFLWYARLMTKRGVLR